MRGIPTRQQDGSGSGRCDFTGLAGVIVVCALLAVLAVVVACQE
jgi:hypothetical protein